MNTSTDDDLAHKIINCVTDNGKTNIRSISDDDILIRIKKAIADFRFTSSITPPAVTAKPDLAAPVEQASKSTLSQQVAHARAEGATWPDSVRESVGIPPQQSPDPIYLICPKAGGTTWTECISKQSHDAAMRLGVYESRVVVEVGGQEKSS